MFDRAAWDAYSAGARDVDIVEAYSRVDVTEADDTVQLDRGEYLFGINHTEPGPESVEVRHLLEIADAR